MTRVALDTNLLVYLVGLTRAASDGHKVAAVRKLIERMRSSAALVVPTQALGELFNVLVRAGFDRATAKSWVVSAHEGFDAAEAGRGTMMAAVDLATTARLQIWDALIINAAAEAGCTLLLSEDLQDGFTWRGLTLVNPLTATPHPKLAALLS